MNNTINTSTRSASILRSVMPVFGRYGYRKASMEDLANAAGLSKQGLYLFFAGKEALFIAAMRQYLDDGLCLVDNALNQPDISLHSRLSQAMDAWFGRHLVTFTPEAFDVIETGDRLTREDIEGYKTAVKNRLAAALSQSAELTQSGNICTARQLSEVLFRFGLTWKEGRPSRAEFSKMISLCICACCQIGAPPERVL